MTAADVQRVAKRYIDPAKMSIVLVGDRATIEAKIAALKLAPITNLTVEDVLGKAPVVEGMKWQRSVPMMPVRGCALCTGISLHAGAVRGWWRGES
ncbi:MAG: hypothetical protein IPI01_13030 [Ignavibacteriae bacterium]|nr:hypothetical protein [Ignavibacteriota bacterium]